MLVFLLHSLETLHSQKQIKVVFIFKECLIILIYLPLLLETNSITKLTINQESLFATLYLFLSNSNQNA